MQRRNPDINIPTIDGYLEIVYMHIHRENIPDCCEISTIQSDTNISNVCSKYCVYSRKR